MTNEQLREWFDEWCDKNNVGIHWSVGEDSPFSEYGFPGPAATDGFLSALACKVEDSLWNEIQAQDPTFRLEV